MGENTGQSHLGILAKSVKKPFGTMYCVFPSCASKLCCNSNTPFSWGSSIGSFIKKISWSGVQDGKKINTKKIINGNKINRLNINDPRLRQGPVKLQEWHLTSIPANYQTVVICSLYHCVPYPFFYLSSW